MSELIAVINEGVRQIHAIAAPGLSDFATLCGLDGHDFSETPRFRNFVDQRPGGEVGRGEKINCDACIAIIRHASTYRLAQIRAEAGRG